MAIFHLSIKITSRGKGKSAVAAAAYRAGEVIINDYDGITHNYTRKSGIVHTEIILPEHAPKEYYNRSILWNSVEKIEKSINSQLAREIELALPTELTKEQNISLVRNYVRRNFVEKGMCADICMHDTGEGNPHAHIMLTMRPINPDGTWGTRHKKEYILDNNGRPIYDRIKKTYKCRRVSSTDWDNRNRAEEWRKSWADFQNEYLKRYNFDIKTDHRSYERQGIEKFPTIHLGSRAFQMEKRGVRTALGNRNREIEDMNKDLRQLNARIRKEKDALYSYPLQDAPGMSDIINNIKSWQTTNGKYKYINNHYSMQEMYDMIVFLSRNGIKDMEDVAKRSQNLYKEAQEHADLVKQQNRRIDTLTMHLSQYDIYVKYLPLVKKFNSLPKNKRNDFHVKYKEQFAKYDAALKYLNNIMNGKGNPPLKEWRKELKERLELRWDLCDIYYEIRKEIKAIEKIHRTADRMIDRVYAECGIDWKQQRSMRNKNRSYSFDR